MNNEILFDTPLIKTTIIEYNRFKIKDIKITLNSSAEIVVLIYPTDVIQNSVICRTIQMTDEEYALWDKDDNYVVNFLKEKIDLNIV